MEKDYYTILQVAPDAEREVIDGAYIRLTQKYHPDINSSPDAAERMKAINEAYDVLSDPGKRAVYDQARKTTRERDPGTSDKTQDARFARIADVLESELRSGCHDETLLGGLESFVRNWAGQFSGEPQDISNTAASIAAFLEGYERISQEERRQALIQALARARNELVPPWRIRRRASSEETARSPIAIRPEARLDAARPIVRPAANNAVSERLRWSRSLVLVGIGIIVALLVIAFLLFQLVVQRPSLAGGCPNGCVTPPPGCVIKGNINLETKEKIYHVPGGEFYDQTTIDPREGERWFCTEQEAVANGWRRSKN